MDNLPDDAPPLIHQNTPACHRSYLSNTPHRLDNRTSGDGSLPDRKNSCPRRYGSVWRYIGIPLNILYKIMKTITPIFFGCALVLASVFSGVGTAFAQVDDIMSEARGNLAYSLGHSNR